MKYIILALLLVSCGGSNKTLTKVQVQSEQDRIDSYYEGRISFRPAFYNTSDSVFASLTGNDKEIFAGLYTAIRAERADDSTNNHSANYYSQLRKALDGIILGAKAGY